MPDRGCHCGRHSAAALSRVSSAGRHLAHALGAAVLFEEKLAARGLITREGADAMRTGFTAELLEASKRVIAEPQPDSSTIWDHVYATKNLVGER